ncbi:MAG: hypothetical protein QWI73_07170, partial [Alphaproteobacteria bacterium]|nr:hypothetical protein [Alphaproteobacteria bacterium]
MTNVIYSPDADLIFLGLTLQDHKLYVMREEFQPGRADITSPSGNPYVNREIVFIDINRLRYLLISQFRQSIPFNFNYRRFIEDWVFMCFAVGNDFLPCLPCFEIRSNAIDKITGLLVSLFKKSRRHITNNGDIDLNALREFFVECSEREDDFLIEKKSNLLSVRKRMNLPLKEEEEFDLNSDAG